jgi:hypothetical protein
MAGESLLVAPWLLAPACAVGGAEGCRPLPLKAGAANSTLFFADSSEVTARNQTAANATKLAHPSPRSQRIWISSEGASIDKTQANF